MTEIEIENKREIIDGLINYVRTTTRATAGRKLKFIVVIFETKINVEVLFSHTKINSRWSKVLKIYNHKKLK